MAKMPACLSRSLGFAALSADSLNMQDDLTSQSIISSSSASSLRRTLSADMSSEKWISQSGLKKVASLDDLHFQDDEDDNGGPGFGSGSGSGAFEDIWSSIQREQQEKQVKGTEKPSSQTDIWSSILTQKAINEQDVNNLGANLPPPYVHPLVKRSASSLSEKSLEICTESLGSETGADCFSPEPACDSDPEEGKEVVEATKEITEPLLQQQETVVVMVMKTKAAAAGAPVRSFPPPLPSLAHRGDGSNVQMRSHRQDGRLVLEAVSVPSNNCFKAERQDGRLLLTFSGRHVSNSERTDVEMVENRLTEDDEEEVCDVTEDSEEEDQETDLEEEEGYDDVEMADDELACGGGGMMSYVAAGHKFLGLTRNMAAWPRRLNTVVNALEQSTATALARSLPLRAHGLNPYVYSWRSKPGPGPTGVVVDGKRAGKVEEDVFLKGCSLQQPKRSLLLWGPHCIATS